MTRFSAQPPAQGLYDPSNEHDACGVAFVAHLSGVPTHEIVQQGLTALRNLDHRGAVVTRVTSRSWWYGGLRQLVLGGAAAGITYLIGEAIGTQVG